MSCAEADLTNAHCPRVWGGVTQHPTSFLWIAHGVGPQHARFRSCSPAIGRQHEARFGVVAGLRQLNPIVWRSKIVREETRERGTDEGGSCKASGIRNVYNHFPPPYQLFNWISTLRLYTPSSNQWAKPNYTA